MLDYKERVHNILSSVHIADICNVRSYGSSTCPLCGGVGKFSVWNNTHYKCWRSSCALNEGGDTIALYRALNPSISFTEALKSLEATGNIFYEKSSKGLKERSRVLEACLDKYSYYLQHSTKALEYMAGRGFSAESCLKYGIGFAPSFNSLRAAGLDAKVLEQQGLLKEGREYYVNRIIFPIYDQEGHLVHFTGRYLGDVPLDEAGEPRLPRYKDSQAVASLIQGTKSYLVFENYLSGYRDDYLVVAEGYPDALSLKDCGIQTVGLLGLEKLTQQATKLSKFKKVICVFDNDFFDIDHPTHPLQYKSWIRIIPQLVELQMILPNTEFLTWMVPSLLRTKSGPPLECKDLNEWVVKSALSSKDIKSTIDTGATSLITSLIEQRGADVSNHHMLIKLVAATGRGKEELNKFISPLLSPIDYALSALC